MKLNKIFSENCFFPSQQNSILKILKKIYCRSRNHHCTISEISDRNLSVLSSFSVHLFLWFSALESSENWKAFFSFSNNNNMIIIVMFFLLEHLFFSSKENSLIWLLHFNYIFFTSSSIFFFGYPCVSYNCVFFFCSSHRFCFILILYCVCMVLYITILSSTTTWRKSLLFHFRSLFSFFAMWSEH